MAIKGIFSKPTKITRLSDKKKITIPKGTPYMFQMAPLGEPLIITIKGVKYSHIIK